MIRRRGFALIGVLWAVVGMSALALTARLVARDLVATSRNRADLMRGRWVAEGCAERARAVVDRVLARDAASGPWSPGWDLLDHELTSVPLLGDCRITARPAGVGIDVNSAHPETLRSLLRAAGARVGEADSLVDAIIDWRDEDSEPSTLGAEADQYRRLGQRGPRNGPFAAPEEVTRVRGMDRIPGVDTLFQVEAGRISLNDAPGRVLAALPGMSPEAVARLLELRRRGERIRELAALPPLLTSAGGAHMLAQYDALNSAVTLQPEAWVLVARADEGRPPLTSVVELKVVRGATRGIVVRRRTWVE
jgi:hypothetical protein